MNFIFIALIIIAIIVVIVVVSKRSSKRGKNEGTYWSNTSCPRCGSHDMKAGYGTRRQCTKCEHMFSA
jgi:ribosomal protein S27AE